MELGQKVSFTKSLSKQTGISVNEHNLTDEQKEIINDGGHIELVRFKEREHHMKTGFIAGKRNITVSVYLGSNDDSHCALNLIPIEHKTEDVFIVACDMRRLFRVRLEDLEAHNE